MNITTNYSILNSLRSPEDMVKASRERGFRKLIVCDSNLSGVIKFYKACKFDKNDKPYSPEEAIKPIIAIKMKVCELEPSVKAEHNKMYDLVLIAKNKTGYKNILKLVSKSNNKENVLIGDLEKTPRIHLDQVKGFTDGVICLLGVERDELKLQTTETSKKYVVEKYKYFFPELINQEETPIVWEDVRYIEKNEREDFLLLLATYFKCNLKTLNYFMLKYGFDHYVDYIYTQEDLGKNPYLASKEEIENKYPKEVLERTEALLDSIEEFELLSKPKVPKFKCPNGLSQKDYLTQLCREGWTRRFPIWEDEEKKKNYADRVKYELGVLQGSELDGYFLVTQDYINWAKNKGWLVCPSRGSVGGSLVAYLLNITDLDPIKDGLLFERFYSSDRAAGGIPTLPDIDTDFPKYKRKFVIDYVKETYGIDRVTHICTFGTLNGAGSLTTVLKGHDVFEEKKIKSITKNIPAPDKVSDKMEEMKEDSVIRYTLRALPDVLKELGWIEEGKIVGEYSYYLEQAIRLEGSIRGYGIHASGILISEEPIEEVAPLIIESNGDTKYCAFDMHDSEASGLVKVDILGVESLDVLMEVNNLLLGVSEDQ